MSHIKEKRKIGEIEQDESAPIYDDCMYARELMAFEQPQILSHRTT